MDQTSSTGSLRCVVVTPEKALLDETVDFVALPLYDGELGVLPGRAPLIARLGPGELRIRQDNNTRRFFVDGGFTQVKANEVTVLTPRAKKAEDVDAAAERELEAAKAPATTPEAQEQQFKAQLRARAQLRIARKVSGEEDMHFGGEAH